MKMLKKIALATALIMAAAGVAQAKEWKTVRIGTEGAYPPFNFFDSNKELQGFDVDIAKALCEKMKVECTYVAQDWDGIIPALVSNKYDAIIASMSITEERKKKVDFTDKYYQTPAGFVMSKGAGQTDFTPEGLKGKTIGAQSATTHASYLEDVYTDSSIKLYGTQDEANLDLANGRLDAILADSVVLGEWLKADDASCCEMAHTFNGPVKYFGAGAGIAIRQGEEELKVMLNTALKEIIDDGTYAAINGKYFPFSIY